MGLQRVGYEWATEHITREEASTNVTADVCNNPLKAIYGHLHQLGEYLRSVRHVA